MNSTLGKHCVLALTLAATGLMAGCATSSTGVRNPNGVPVTEMRPDERGFVATTGIESQDLVTMADQMARSILNTPEIANAKGRPCIVLDPIKNETRFPINKDMFLTRIQTLLIQRAGNKVMFLARDRMDTLLKEQNLKKTGQVTASSDPNVVEFKGADFFLTGKFQGMTAQTGAGISDTVQYVFELDDARTSVIVWSDMRTIKRQGLEDAAYR